MNKLLLSSPFGHIPRKFSLNRTTIRLKLTENLPQKSMLSLRFSFLDSLLGACHE